jgi:hypothetical protein
MSAKQGKKGRTEGEQGEKGRGKVDARKCLNNPCTGHAAASPNAQIVCPSICFVNSHNISISLSCARPTTKRSIIFSNPVVPSRQGVHWAARLVHVELGETGDGADDVGLLVHDDDSASTESGSEVAERVEVHTAEEGESVLL